MPLYNSAGVATPYGSAGTGGGAYQSTMGLGPQGGSGYLGTMGMSPEYNDQLFAHIQKGISSNRDAQRQSVLDNTSRFGQGGGQDASLMAADKNAADQGIDALSGAEMQGAGLARQDRNAANDRFFTADQNQQNRTLQNNMQNNMLGQDSWQFNANRTDAQQAQMMKLFTSMMGAGMGGQ